MTVLNMQSFYKSISAYSYLSKRFFSINVRLQHQNPLGLPQKGPPGIAHRMAKGLPVKKPIDGVKHIIAVASGKGGVGKSTVAVNLAVSLSNLQQKVGLLDADLFGPSIPRMTNLSGEPELTSQNKLRPLQNYGIKCMSMGFMVQEDNPVVWRGLMVMKALEQLIRDVDWGELDILVIDMPPGTGDTQLTISQQVPLDGAVIVSTPQDIALIDVKKGVNMFRKVDVPIFGVVENMAYHLCPNCSHKSHIFGNHSNLVKSLSTLQDNIEEGSNNQGTSNSKNGVQVIGQIPLNEDICALSDAGTPIVVMKRGSEIEKEYRTIAEKVLGLLSNKK